jgi:hypothetical protein
MTLGTFEGLLFYDYETKIAQDFHDFRDFWGFSALSGADFIKKRTKIAQKMDKNCYFHHFTVKIW